MPTIQAIQSVISSHFPEKCAESWDNPGLQLGRRKADVKRVLTALELTPDIVDEAIQTGTQLVVTHHPFIFRPIKSLTDANPDGDMLLTLAEHGIGLLAAHTNLDSAPDAIVKKLADDLGLSGRHPFLEHHPYEAYKIVVFVPRKDAEAVARAMHAKGAGCVGQYSSVSFSADGVGRFTCGADSHPAIGTPGSVESVEETRLEMVVSGRELKSVIQALLAAHPYEEPAFDVFRLESEVHGMTDYYGFGIAGRLPEPVRLDAFVAHLKKIWEIPAVRAAGNAGKMISNVAILNGSGAKYLSSCRGIDAFITGDCGHHDFDNAIRQNVALIDAGHYDTEKFIPRILADVLESSEIGGELEIRIAESMRNPMTVY